jgi:hypothetical protein
MMLLMTQWLGHVSFTSVTEIPAICSRAKKKICGFPVSRPYLAFGRRNPDPKLFYLIMLNCFHLEEKVCGKLKFEAILGKFISGCGSTD